MWVVRGPLARKTVLKLWFTPLHQVRGGQLFWLGGHHEEAAFRGGPYLLIEREASLGSFSLNTRGHKRGARGHQIARWPVLKIILA